MTIAKPGEYHSFKANAKQFVMNFIGAELNHDDIERESVGGSETTTIEELVRDKRVILVGNSVEIMNYEYGDFIDSFDIVIHHGSP